MRLNEAIYVEWGVLSKLHNLSLISLELIFFPLPLKDDKQRYVTTNSLRPRTKTSSKVII